MAHQMLFLSFLLAIAAMQGSHAVNFTVINDNGGPRFNDEIGVNYSRQALENATYFIWETFQQNNAADDYRQNVSEVILTITIIVNATPEAGTDDVYPFYLNGSRIYIDANYIENFTIDDLKREFTGIVYHASTHVWQFNLANNPVGLNEGIGDFVRLHAGYPRRDWKRPGEGTNWDDGDEVTAWFLDYLHGLRRGFVAELNKRVETGYNESYFVDLLGKTVDQLWSDFRALHGFST